MLNYTPIPYTTGEQSEEHCMERLQIEIQGMSCGHCVGAVERALGELEGVSITSLAVGRAEVAFDAAKADAPTILAAVTEAGYPARAAAVAS